MFAERPVFRHVRLVQTTEPAKKTFPGEGGEALQQKGDRVRKDRSLPVVVWFLPIVVFDEELDDDRAVEGGTPTDPSPLDS